MLSVRPLLLTAACLLAPSTGAQTLLFSESGEAAFDFFGVTTAVLPDLDGDGVNEYAVSAPLNDAGGSSAGKVSVVSGRTRTPLYTWLGGPGDRLGSDLVSVGDWTGDGVAELAVGASGGEYVAIRDGATGLLHQTLTGPTGFFGFALAGGGDVDADGVQDLIVCAPGISPGGGAVVFSGATATPVRTHTHPCLSDLGHSAAFVGDQDGDGRDEYVLGRTVGIVGCGPPDVRAYDGATGTLQWINAGAQSWDQLGYSVAALQDLNADGIAEVLAGAPQDPGVGCGPCNGRGYVRCLDGATGTTLWQVDGTGFYDGLGSTLAVLEDLDGDGYRDFAVSQPGSDGSGCGGLPMQVRSGLAGALLLEIPPQHPGDAIGAGLAAGDLNGDGLEDLLVGASCADDNGTSSGAAYAYTIVRTVVPYCDGKPNSQGCLPSIHATGTPSLGVGTFRIRAADVLNNKFGTLFWGRTPAATPFQGGTLCVKPPLTRTPPQASGGNAGPDDCSGTYVFHFSGFYMTTAGVQPGEQIYCQYWSRDPQGTAGTGLTDGLAFLVLP